MKENKNNRKKWLHVRLTEAEYERIQRQFRGTVHDRMSDFARAMLLRKPIIGVYQNTALKEVLAELSALKKDIHGIAINYNQTVRKLNSSALPESVKMLPSLESDHEIILKSLRLVEHYLHQTAQKWLQS
jgi:hypothetical protein